MTKQQAPDNPVGATAPRPTEERHIEHDSVLDRGLISGGVTWWALWGVVAFLLGVAFRLINLDSYALTALEGRLAFQGWSVYVGESAFGVDGVPETRPLIQLAEALTFFISGATDVTARLAPVAFGIGTLGLVFLLRQVSHRGTVFGILLTVGLSPSLVYFSRTIDTPIFIAFFSMLLVVAIARSSITYSETRLMLWACLAGVAIAGLIASGPMGITAGIAALLAIAASAITATRSSRRSADAIGAGARRIAGTPGALLLALGTTLLALLVLFTRLFSDIDAVTGILDTFADWGRMVGTQPTTTPTQFFFWATLLYEPVAVVLLLVALLTSPLHLQRDNRPVLSSTPFAIWFATALILLSLSSGREPHQFALVSLPLAIAAGIGLGHLLQRVERYRLFTSIAGLVPAAVLALLIGVIAIGMVIARSNDPGAAGGNMQTLGEVAIIMLLVIIPFSVILARESAQKEQALRLGWAALLVGVALLGLFGVRSASMLAFERSDEGTEMLAQETTTEGVTAFADQVTRLSRDLTVGEATLADPSARFGLSISISPSIPDPYRWYFRDFPDVNVTTAAGWGDSDVVIAPTSEAMEEAGFIVHARTQFNRVPPAYEGLNSGTIFSHIWSPSNWYDGIRFLLFRDTIAEPPPQQIAIGYEPELSNQINPALGPFNLTDSPGRGSALGQFDTPIGIGHSTDGEVIYVTDSANQRVLRYNTMGEFIGVWSGEQDPNLDFATAFDNGPNGLEVSADDLVYVADTWNHRVVVIDRSGQFIREIGQRGGQTDLGDDPDPTGDPGLFFGPRGIAVHEGEIYVTDTGNERVQVFASDGTFLRAFGGYGTEPGKLIEPVGIEVAEDGTVYVADSGNARLSIFESDGTPVDQVPVPNWEGQATMINMLELGNDGLLYMTAPSVGVVDIFDPASNTIIGSTQGPVDNPLEQPLGITMMPDGELLVTDGNLHDVVRFTPNPPPLPEPATPAATREASPVAATPAA